MAISTVKATINGTEYTLTWNGASSKYEATITAPTITSFNQPGGYYGVTVDVTDVAGNKTTQTSSNTANRLTVKEKIPPVISNISPAANARLTTASPTFTFRILDEANGSGVNTASVVVKIDGGTPLVGLKTTAITNGYDCTIDTSGLSQGSHTITFDAKDNDGNSAVQKSVTFTVDTIAPTLNVTAPVNALVTKTAALSVVGNTNDVTSGPVTVTIKLNGTDQGAVTVDGSGNFSKSITLANGSNTIVITATDSSGLTTDITRTVTLDTTAPVISLVEITPNPVDAGATFVIKVTATDA